MKRMIVASVLAALVVPGVASAKLSHSDAVKYGHAYQHAKQAFGANTVGCKLIGPGASCRRETDDMVRRSTEVLHRMFAPKPRPVYHAVFARTSTASSSTSSYSAGGSCGGVTPYSGGGQCWAIPYSIVSCESGGANVPNSQGSGANGYYQLMSGGGGSRSEQDQAAAALWAGGAGRGNWKC